MKENNFNYTNIDELLTIVKSGDHSAFEEIITRYRKLVIHIVYRMISNSADREDLFQDIFIKVYKNIKYFRAQSKFSTWIGKISYNTCLNHLKKNKAESIEEDILNKKVRSPFSNPDPLPDKLTIEKDITGHVHKEIERLNYIYRTVLTLFHLEEMSYKEISTIMNIPQGSVKSYLFRARKELKKRIMLKFRGRKVHAE